MAEILIRHHAPEWATEIDFSTLREESTGLVSKKTHQRRHPDMIWSADTGPDFRPGDPLPEFVYLVLYHGDGPWTAPARMTDLFTRSDPGRYRLVPWGDAGDDGSRDDLTAVVLGLARNLSPEDMSMQLSALWRAVETNGAPGLDGLMVQMVATMLQLRDYPRKLMKGGAKTMAEVVDRFQQGMDELVQRGARQGRAQILRRLVTRRFGEETAGQFSHLLDEPPGLVDIDRVTDALVECVTGDEFIDRVRRIG